MKTTPIKTKKEILNDMPYQRDNDSEKWYSDTDVLRAMEEYRSQSCPALMNEPLKGQEIVKFIINYYREMSVKGQKASVAHLIVKVQERLLSHEGKEEPNTELFQCPYDKAIKCLMNEGCYGCEEWAKKRKEECSNCKGSGRVTYGNGFPEHCPQCNGIGELPIQPKEEPNKENWKDKVSELVSNDKKFEAIKVVFANNKGWGVKKAKEYVDSIIEGKEEPKDENKLCNHPHPIFYKLCPFYNLSICRSVCEYGIREQKEEPKPKEVEPKEVTDDKMYLNMQYYMEYCQAKGYVTPQDWIEKHKHF